MTVKISILAFPGQRITEIKDIVKQAGHIEQVDVHLWEMSGQSRFSVLWEKMIAFSLGVLVVIDVSTIENLFRSKNLVAITKKQAPYSQFAIIAIVRSKDTRDDELIHRILDSDVPVHFLYLDDRESNEELVEFLRNFINECVKITIPEVEPEKELPIDRGILLLILRAWLERALSNSERTDEIVDAIKQECNQAMEEARKILLDGNIPEQGVDWLFRELSRDTQGGRTS